MKATKDINSINVSAPSSTRPTLTKSRWRERNGWLGMVVIAHSTTSSSCESTQPHCHVEISEEGSATWVEVALVESAGASPAKSLPRV